ncbi:hypothetical protein AWZ03_001972 [Drosophila navojoa]|uniref:DUF4794 domain-containing protein n=1 Tax=Drosophila navojoa TaxID=7232 RepID=A0A484BTG4_DRONA|nr:uncharacterized protein LOC108653614 [Drosophila navojoa]TDG51512.1 hypothetical protein AWZ03_001972 [Drosophila navojoa]
MSNGSLILLLWAFCSSVAATPTSSIAQRRAQLQEDVQLLHPQIITIERLEHLLRRAGEIFGPVAQVADSESAGSQLEPQVEMQVQPQQYMLPPTDQPYNFYLPLYDYIDPKLDAKSRHMEKIAPPPQRLQQEHNYYADKPKKTPKKFNAAAKHVNLKWLNTYEKAMGGVAPKAIYLEQDERNRINFDDSFFAVDMHVKTPDNQPHKESGAVPAELLQHGEQLAEDDLMAAPAQLTYSYKPTEAMKQPV